jgi:hypothetical protein
LNEPVKVGTGALWAESQQRSDSFPIAPETSFIVQFGPYRIKRYRMIHVDSSNTARYFG